MEIFNECNAPGSFADTIYEAAEKSSHHLIHEFGLTGTPVSDVYIIGEKEPEDSNIPDEYKNTYFIDRLEKIMAKIKHIKYCYDIKQCYDLINEIYVYISMMLDIANQAELEITEKQRIKIKEHLMAEIAITLEIHYGDCETDMKLNEILQDILEAEQIFPMLYIPSKALGCFDQNNERIYICYKTIHDYINEKNSAGQYGSYVFAHEFFHAYHCLHLNQKTADSGVPYRARVQNSTVKESLAEYFAYTYAQKYTEPQILKKAGMYRIPAWGYTGTEIFKNYQSLSAGVNPLFSAVYYCSLIDMGHAYRMLCDFIK